MNKIPWIAGVVALVAAGGIGLKAYSVPKPLPETTIVPEAYVADLADKNIAFYIERTKNDPQGYLNFSILADAYLTRSREHGADIHDAISAEKAARESLKIWSKANERGYMALAQSLKAQHRFAEAMEAAKQAEKIAPQKRSPKRLQIDLLLELGEYEKAESARKAFVPDISDPGDLCLEARFSHLRGNPQLAIEQLKKARAKTLNNWGVSAENAAWYYDHIGELLAGMGRIDEAAAEYRKALAVFPRDHKAMLAQARWDAAKGNWKSALPVAEKVAKLVEAPHTAAFVGDCKVALGDRAGAEKFYQKAEQIGRESRAEGIIDDDRLSAAFNLDHNRNVAEALVLAKKEIAHRKDIYAYDTLAWALLKNGKLAEADVAMKKAMSLGTKDAMLLFHAGMIAKAKGDSAAAKAHMQEALKLNPLFHPTFAKEARSLAGVGD